MWIPSYVWPERDPPGEMARLDAFIRAANRYDVDLWAIDHLLPATELYAVSWLEPLSLLSYAAAAAPDVALGTGILVLPLREPVVLAKQLATLDRLSGGRLQLGVGPGWYPAEFAAVGVNAAERGARTDELVAALRLLLSNDAATFTGRHYRFSDVTIEPRPPVPPPLWVGGGSKLVEGTSGDLPTLAPRVLDRILGADWWLARAAGSQTLVLRDWATIRSEAGRRGVVAPRFAHCNFCHLVDTPDPARARAEQLPRFQAVMGLGRSPQQLETSYLFGTIDEIAARLRTLGEAGCEYVVLGPVSDEVEQLDLLSDLLIPRLA